jgi:hypothetical protein
MKYVSTAHVAGFNSGLVVEWGTLVDKALHLWGNGNDFLNLRLDDGDVIRGLDVDFVGVAVDADLDEHDEFFRWKKGKL